MRVQILGAATGPGPGYQYVSSYLINGTLAVDAGSLGFWATADEQKEVTDLLLTHSHQDHVASLPFFLENVYGLTSEPVRLHARRDTLAALQSHVFNGVLWPDFFHLLPEHPFVRLHEVVPEERFDVNGLQVVPVDVHHVVPTLGYVVSDGKSTVVLGADSGPTERLWQVAAEFPAPRLIFLEAAFPDSMSALAGLAQHLTPKTFATEVQKLPPFDKLVAIHLKPRFRDQIAKELLALGLPRLTIGDCETTYEI